MNNKPSKSKLTPAIVKAMASDFWHKTPIRRHDSGHWKVITLFHGMPADAPEQKAEAHYSALVGASNGLDTIYAAHTAQIPGTGMDEAYKLRNATLRDAVQCGISVVTTVQDGDTAIVKILQTAKDKGYRIEMQSYLSHMGADAPSDDYDWKSHVGALRILPQLQDLCDTWQLNWQRQPYALTETVMSRYIGLNDDGSVSDLYNQLAKLYPKITQDVAIAYDAILYGHRGDAANARETLLALHLGNDIIVPDADIDAPAEPLVVTVSPDLRSGDFFRLLRRISVDINRLNDDYTRAFTGLHHAQRASYQSGLSALHDMIKTHVGDKMEPELSVEERAEMGFKLSPAERLSLNKI